MLRLVDSQTKHVLSIKLKCQNTYKSSSESSKKILIMFFFFWFSFISDSIKMDAKKINLFINLKAQIKFIHKQADSIVIHQ